MLDVDTFLTALYVIVADFCQSHEHPQLDFSTTATDAPAR